MQFNHVNLPVADVAASEAFFATDFGMTTILDLGRNTMVMMEDGQGMVLNISNFHKGSEIIYPKDFHIGFFFTTREEVDAMHVRMTGDGLEAEEPKRLAGRYGYYLASPGGFTTEVACLEMRPR